MAQINKSSEYFNTVLYTGNGASSNAITGVGFQPDFLWIKERNNTRQHQLMDVVRGASVRLQCSSTNAESASALNSFDSDGFDVNGSTLNGTNFNTGTYVAWNWLAGGTASSNTDGSITSNVSASTTSGFSIVSYTGTGANATVGHGLGSVPKMIITKNRDQGTYNWTSYHVSLGNTGRIRLNLTDAAQTGQTNWNSTTPTSSVFSLGTNADVNGSGENIIAYCFAEKKGFSKFGSYTGNGSTDGTFVYTGFKPAFVVTKRTNDVSDWLLWDNKRPERNETNLYLLANSSNIEATDGGIDILSNGFKARKTGTSLNVSGSTYIYMAFAENPLVGTNNIPTTAR